MTLYGRQAGNGKRISTDFQSFLYRSFQGEKCRGFASNYYEYFYVYFRLVFYCHIVLKNLRKIKRVFFPAILFSGTIECTQGMLRMGMFEADDILGNVLGAELGFSFFVLCVKS